jgi:hypothetical protein
MLDIDALHQLEQFETRLKKFSKDYKVENTEIVESFSGPPHCHIYIRLEKPLPVMTRIFLQMWLGSDPIKEYLSVRRVMIGDNHPILMLEKVKPEGF